MLALMVVVPLKKLGNPKTGIIFANELPADPFSQAGSCYELGSAI
jgi:hypothetical protein